MTSPCIAFSTTFGGMNAANNRPVAVFINDITVPVRRLTCNGFEDTATLEAAFSSPAGQVTMAHADCLLALDSTTGRQLARRFERELLAKAQQPDTRLIVGCTIRPAAEGLGHADTLAMMAVTPQWLPFEHLLERVLLVELVRRGRRFLKPLPYEAGPSAAFASALLLDAGDATVPLHLEPPSAGGQRGSRADDERTVPGPKRWTWRPGEALVMPALPRATQAPARSVVS